MPRFQTTEFALSTIGDQFSDAGSLHLMFRQTALGDFSFQQFWVPKPGLFGTRNNRSGNHSVVLNFFRSICIDQVTDRHETSAKVHLLASLLPLVRSNGSQRVFPDASAVTARNYSTRSEFCSETLEIHLKASETEQTTLVEFCKKNREAVEFPNFPDTMFNMYREFESDLLVNATDQWWYNPTGAQLLVEQRWLQWCDGFGRRRGNKEKKDVLDILSYECKAAFHQAYSALWVEMIPHLIAGNDNQLFSQRFHTLWHLDHRIAVPGQDRDICLLHGLVLGLHPTFGTLLKTDTGSRLVGETVAAPEDTDAQQRFLHAALVSLYLYAAARRSRITSLANVGNTV